MHLSCTFFTNHSEPRPSQHFPFFAVPVHYPIAELSSALFSIRDQSRFCEFKVRFTHKTLTINYSGYPYGPPLLGLKFGHLTTLTYKSVVYVQLAIAFNRFVATFFTFKYPNICHRKGTFVSAQHIFLQT